MVDLYEVLGVDSDSPEEMIKAAYRSLAQQYHPDKCRGDSARFLEIQGAYEVLSDPERRKAYDAGGRTGPRSQHIYNMAMRDLSALLLAIVEQCGDPHTTDVLGSIRKTIENATAHASVERLSVVRSITKLETAAANMQVAEGEYNVLADTLRAHIVRKNKELATLEETQAVRDLMLKLVEPYVYNFQRQGIWAAASTTTATGSRW